MNQKDLLKKIKEKAKQDVKNRKDPRFLTIIGFLVGKGFLRVNYPVAEVHNKTIAIDDAIWAGLNVEPRILEVLPAAVLRLEKHFDLNADLHPALYDIVTALRKKVDKDLAFHGIPFAKIKIWADFPLRDGRVKPVSEKKITKTFRIKPSTQEILKKMARQNSCTETEIFEKLIASAR